MHEVDVVATPQLLPHAVDVGGDDAHDPVVGRRDRREAGLGERGHPVVDLDAAGPHRREHHPDPEAPQLRDQRGQHGLDPPVALRRHRQPRARVDEDRQGTPGHHGHRPVVGADLAQRRSLLDGDVGLDHLAVEAGRSRRRGTSELHERRRLGSPREDALTGQPGGRGELDLGRHPPERLQVVVSVHAHAQVDLGHGVETHAVEHVDEHAQLDAVAGDERDGLEQLAARGELAGERLHEPGQLRPGEVEERAGDELAHPAAAVDVDGAVTDQRPVVEALDEGDAGIVEQRAEQPGDEARLDVTEIGVDRGDEVAGARGEALPQRLALAVRGSEIGHHRVLPDHGRAGGRSDLGGGVLRPGVDDEDLVHETGAVDEGLADDGDDPADRGGLVTGGEHEADPPAGLLLDHALRVPSPRCGWCDGRASDGPRGACRVVPDSHDRVPAPS